MNNFDKHLSKNLKFSPRAKATRAHAIFDLFFLTVALVSILLQS